jgi:putative hemolysin
MQVSNQKWLIVLGTAVVISLVVSLVVLILALNQNNSLREEVTEIEKKQNDLKKVSNELSKLANPASVYCEKQGGVSEIVTAPDGSQSGVCKFEDGSECEEWAYFRGECQMGKAEEVELKGELVAIDNDWNLYTNNELGFSVKVPKNVFIDNNAQEPVEIIESDNVVYISNQSSLYYEKISDLLANDTDSELSDIEKKKGIPWGMIVRNINNEKELDNFIKEMYGSGCSLGDKKASQQENTYDVTIKGDGLGLDKTKCPINFILHVKYSSEFKKAAIWDIGHDYNFRVTSALDGTGGGDTEMAESFKFVN